MIRFLRDADLLPSSPREWRRAITLTILFLGLFAMPGIVDQLLTRVGI